MHFGWQVVATITALKVRAEKLEGTLFFPPWLPPSTETRQTAFPLPSASQLSFDCFIFLWLVALTVLSKKEFKP